MFQYLDLEEFQWEWRILDDGEIQLWDGSNYATYSEILELSEWLIKNIKGVKMKPVKKGKKILAAPKPKTTKKKK